MSELDRKESPFKSVLHKIKAFLRRQKWREAFIFFCFFLLSLGFWALQSLQQEYEIGITIPVKYKNIPADISLVGEVPEEIRVQVRDKGSVLLNYSFGRKFVPIECNFKGVNTLSESGSFILQQKDIESDIQKQLIASTSLVSYSPHQIDLRFSKRAQKEVAVLFNGRVSTEQGYQFSGDITIEPAYVMMYAAGTMLDTIMQIETDYVEFKKATKTITRVLPLQKIKGAAYDPESVTITIPIEEFTEKELEIPIVVKDVPNQYILRLFPASVKVLSNIPLSRFNEVTADQFEIVVPFDSLEQNLSGIHTIELTEMPDWINSASIRPDRIEFIIEQKRTYND